MLRTNVGPTVRELRRERRWRQADLAARAGTSRATVSRLECGDLRGLPIGTVEQITHALGASVELMVRWHGARLDRLLDARHASVSQLSATLLSVSGWLVEPEVSFNHYGERGRVDLLAFHPPSAALLVVEVKSAIGDLQETLGRLDVKARLGRTLAQSVGWNRVESIIPAFVIADSRRVRRILAEHDALFRRFSLRGRAAVAWLRRPRPPPPSGLIWFVNMPDSHGVSVTRDRRVRTVRNGLPCSPGGKPDGSQRRDPDNAHLV